MGTWTCLWLLVEVWRRVGYVLSSSVRLEWRVGCWSWLCIIYYHTYPIQLTTIVAHHILFLPPRERAPSILMLESGYNHPANAQTSHIHHLVRLYKTPVSLPRIRASRPPVVRNDANWRPA